MSDKFTKDDIIKMKLEATHITLKNCNRIFRELCNRSFYMDSIVSDMRYVISIIEQLFMDMEVYMKEVGYKIELNKKELDKKGEDE
jgi:hypothetical protein